MATFGSLGGGGPFAYWRSESGAGGRGQGGRPTSLSDSAPRLAPRRFETRITARPCTEAGPLHTDPVPALGTSKSEGCGMPDNMSQA